jgi:hypothetical protein
LFSQFSDSDADEADEAAAEAESLYKCECGICLCPFSQPYAGTCGHIFCKQCLLAHNVRTLELPSSKQMKTAHRKSIRVRDNAVRTLKYVKGHSSKADMSKLSTSQFALSAKVLAVSICPMCRTSGAFSRLYLS